MSASSNKGVLSRRAFVSGIGVAAASIAAAKAAMAEETADETQVEMAKSAWGTSYPWTAEPPVINDDQIEEEIDCDVCVIGLGVSGVAAFHSACDQGVKVVAFEKGEQPSVRSSQYAYINGTKTEELGLGTVDEDALIKAEWLESAKVASYAIIRDFVRNESDAMDWWMDTAGAHLPEPGETDGFGFEDPNAPITVSSMVDLSIDYLAEEQSPYPTRISFGNHMGVVMANLQAGIDEGGEVYFGHFGEQLIMEDGRCVGAFVRNAETGMYKKVNAAKGVVLSMGGCASNKEISAVMYPAMSENGNMSAWPNLDVEGNPTNTGDVYPMGYWAGAAFSQNMCAMTHVMGGPCDIPSMGDSTGFTTQHLRLNYNGMRFMNEDSDVTDSELPLERQPKRKAFMIIDSHFDEQVPECVTEFTSTLEAIEGRVDGETVFKADTLEGLFDAIVAYDPDFNKENALASVERYNELCANGYDEDFGKKAKYLFPVLDGPFYAQRMGIGLCLTVMGGLCSDEHAHVIGTDRQVIPGLYVSGNSQGDRFAVKYPFRLSGASHAMAMYYGYVAGKNAAQGL